MTVVDGPEDECSNGLYRVDGGGGVEEFESGLNSRGPTKNGHLRLTRPRPIPSVTLDQFHFFYLPCVINASFKV